MTDTIITKYINALKGLIDSKISTHNTTSSSSTKGHAKAGSTPQQVQNSLSAGTDNGLYARADHVHTIDWSKVTLGSSNNTSKNVVTDSNGKFTVEDKPTIPSGSSTASDIKMNGTQSAGSSSNFAKADHVHPSDTSKADVGHTHGNITNDGKVGTTSGKPLITTTDGVVIAGRFGGGSGQFAEGNHNHSGTYVDGVTGKNTTNGSALAEIKANTTVKGTVYHPKVNSNALTGVPTENKSPSFGGSFTVSQPSVNTDGHVTGLTTRTINMPSLPSTMTPSAHQHNLSDVNNTSTMAVTITYTDNTSETKNFIVYNGYVFDDYDTPL